MPCRRYISSLPLLLQLALLLLLTATAGGCVASPEAAVQDLQSALAADDLEDVANLCSRASRPLVRAVWLATPGPTSPFRLKPGAKSATVVSVRQQGTRQVAVVRAASVEREWVFVQEDGQWRLDLLETAMRRPWNGP